MVYSLKPVFIGIVAYKGGVGKTTLSTLLGVGLSFFMNKKVLLIDLDPQANLTEVFLTRLVFNNIVIEAERKNKVFSLDFFLRPDREPVIVSVRETRNNLYILPSHYKFMRTLELLNIPVDIAITARARLGELAERYGFEHIILDLPPQMYYLVTPIASISTDYILSPASKGAFNDIAIYYMLQTFYEATKTLRRSRSLNKYLGVVLTKFFVNERRNIEIITERINKLVNKFINDEKLVDPDKTIYPETVFKTVVFYNPVLNKLRGVIVGKTPYIIRVFNKYYKGFKHRPYYDRLIENTRELINELNERIDYFAGIESKYSG